MEVEEGKWVRGRSESRDSKMRKIINFEFFIRNNDEEDDECFVCRGSSSVWDWESALVLGVERERVLSSY